MARSSRFKKRGAFCGLVGALIVASIFFSLPTSPRYQGKTVSQWLNEISVPTESFPQDLPTEFGMRAFPDLLNVLRKERRMNQLLQLLPGVSPRPPSRRVEATWLWLSILYSNGVRLDEAFLKAHEPEFSGFIQDYAFFSQNACSRTVIIDQSASSAAPSYPWSE
jgi:hypothetical protein